MNTYTAEELFEIAKEEYRRAGMEATAEGAGEWACLTAEQIAEGKATYTEEEIREELRAFIADEKQEA